MKRLWIWYDGDSFRRRWLNVIGLAAAAIMLVLPAVY